MQDLLYVGLVVIFFGLSWGFLKLCQHSLALRGVRYQPVGAATLLRNNLLIYGVGGLIVPFIGIKAIDLLLVGLGLT